LSSSKPAEFAAAARKLPRSLLLGWLFFGLIMAALFFSIFTLAEYPMNWIDAHMAALGGWVKGVMSPGDLRDLHFAPYYGWLVEVLTKIVRLAECYTGEEIPAALAERRPVWPSESWAL